MFFTQEWEHCFLLERARRLHEVSHAFLETRPRVGTVDVRKGLTPPTPAYIPRDRRRARFIPEVCVPGLVYPLETHVRQWLGLGEQLRPLDVEREVLQYVLCGGMPEELFAEVGRMAGFAVDLPYEPKGAEVKAWVLSSRGSEED